MQQGALSMQEDVRSRVEGEQAPAALPTWSELCTLLYQHIRPQSILRGHVAENGVDIAVLLDCAARSDTGSAVLCRFDHENSGAHSAQYAIAFRKILRRRKDA